MECENWEEAEKSHHPTITHTKTTKQTVITLATAKQRSKNAE